MFYKYFLTAFLFLLISYNAHSQNDYVSGNNIRIYIEGVDFVYQYSSDNLMVRLNDDKSRIECLLMLETLVPENDSSPTILVQDVFYNRKYPQFSFSMTAPLQALYSNDLQPEPFNLPGIINFQGRSRNEEISTVFSSKENGFMFRSEFNFSIQEMEGTIPRKYKTMLTGNIRVLVLNANFIQSISQPRGSR